MKRFTVILGLLLAASTQFSCSVKEIATPADQASPRIFRAVLEPTAGADETRAYADKDYQLFWNEKDRLSIFYDYTFNREYEFAGLDGATAGWFKEVGDYPGKYSQQEIKTQYDYAILPFDELHNMCDTDGNLTVFIQANQEYYKDRLGIGVRPLMIARSKDPDNGDLMFKHVGSYVGVRLKGKGVKVSSISIQGNNSELIAGRLKFSFDKEGLPVGGFDPKFLSDASESITMTLDNPVELSEDNYQVFWFNLPEITFEKGLVITITDIDGKSFEINKTDKLTFKRTYFYKTSATLETGSSPIHYTKASSMTTGGTYLIVDAEDKRLFTGASSGSFIDITPENSVITDSDGSLAGYEFTVEENGDLFFLQFNDGKYLVCDFTGNSSGLNYVNAQSDVKYPYVLTTGDNDAFFFSTSQVNYPNKPDQILYYKAEENRFKIGGSGTNIGVHLYLKDGKQDRGLRFDPDHVTCTLDDIPVKPVLSGLYTTVVYSSSDSKIATVDADGNVTPVSTGTVTITATAEQSYEYYGATASYTLNIIHAPSQDWQDLGTFSLENRALQDYLDDANRSYSDTDDANNSVMATYAASSAYASIDRKDCPNPVTIKWTYSSASNSTVIAIYEDKTLSSPIWSQNATASSTSSEVYNLIPGRTYYYTVSENDTVWEKGYFNTTGRRRMIKVSDIEKKGHANNCRDLGGLVVNDKGTKKTIKYGYIFRGTNMDKTTDAEKSLLTGFLNIGMDIDLRKGEASSSGSSEDGNGSCYKPFNSPYNVGYVNPGFNSFEDLTTASSVKSVLTAFLGTAKSGKASYFHCYIGADRTGYFAMLIEGLLGVSEKDCSIDYELTSFSEAAGLRYRTGRPQDYYFRKGIEFLRKQNGDTFQDKIENYVKSIGITQAQIDEFKSIVLE